MGLNYIHYANKISKFLMPIKKLEHSWCSMSDSQVNYLSALLVAWLLTGDNRQVIKVNTSVTMDCTFNLVECITKQ